MMKKILVCTLAAAVLLSMCAVSFAAQRENLYTVTISDKVEDAVVHAGDAVAMDVTVGGDSFNAFDLYVTYDTGAFTYVNAVNTDANTKVEVEDGVIRIQSLSKEQYADGATVTTLNFTANSVAATTEGDFGFQSAVVQAPADADYDVIPVATYDTDSVTVEYVAASRSSGGGSSGACGITLGEAENGTATVNTTRAVSGRTVTITAAPAEGYEVDAVTVTDAGGNAVAVKDNGDGTYSFIMPASAVSVQVTFAEADQREHENCPSDPYVDVIRTEWYHEAVDYVIVNGYFNGVSETTFEPDTAMTRGMFVTVLARMSGMSLNGYAQGGFADVAQGTWYTAPVVWAAEQGIVQGYGDGNFGPGDSLTREQMAVMMRRYAKCMGADVSNTDRSRMNTFADSDAVSGWAAEDVAWAINTGIMNGTGAGISPLNGASRAEVAQILMNYEQQK